MKLRFRYSSWETWNSIILNKFLTVSLSLFIHEMGGLRIK